MLTKVILEGPLGKRFGREWELDVRSPREALRLVNANAPGVFVWMRDNASKFANYAVICKKGTREDTFSEEQYVNQEGVYDEIRFVPVVEGAGNVFRVVVGVVLMVVDFMTGYTSGGYLSAMGAAMVLGGVAGMLAPKPKIGEMATNERKDKTSYYFDGPANTDHQGVPVQLTYGRCMVGSHSISAAVTVDQLM